MPTITKDVIIAAIWFAGWVTDDPDPWADWLAAGALLAALMFGATKVAEAAFDGTTELRGGRGEEVVGTAAQIDSTVPEWIWASEAYSGQRLKHCWIRRYVEVLEEVL